MIVKEQFNSVGVNIIKWNIIKSSIGYFFALMLNLFFYFIRTLQLWLLDWGSRLFWSDILFYKGSFRCIFYCLLVEERFRNVNVSHKWYYFDWKRSYFESECNFQYLLERTTVSIRPYKRKFLFELLYSKENLGDQINKNNSKNRSQHVL